MNKWAKISNGQAIIANTGHNIMTTRLNQMYIQPCQLGETEGYFVKFSKEDPIWLEANWKAIENELYYLGVKYVSLENKQNTYPFSMLEEVTGKEMRNILSPYLIGYIFKYHLIKQSPNQAILGVVAGRINITLEILKSVACIVPNIILITSEPSIYEEVIQDMPIAIKNKIRIMYPNFSVFQKLHIVLDNNIQKSYVEMCDMRTIYIDLNKNTDTKATYKLGQRSPIIWQNFEVLFKKRSVDLDVLQLAYYAMGYTKHTLARQIKQHNIKITKVESL